jgi:hypothetical protein
LTRRYNVCQGEYPCNFLSEKLNAKVNVVIASRTRVCRQRNYIPLLVGFDSGKMAGLGQPDSFIASSTCKSTGCTSILTQQRTDRGLYRPRFASVKITIL